MKLPEWVVPTLCRVPLFGPLHLTTRRDHYEAATQLVATLIFSTMPIWGGAIAVFLKQEPTDTYTIWACLKGMIIKGELFIYAASTVAPVIYITTRDRYGIGGIPSKTSFIIFSFICSTLSTIVFTIQRLSPTCLPGSMINTSVWLFVISIIIVYLALVYNNNCLPNPAMKMREQEMGFEERLRKLHS